MRVEARQLKSFLLDANIVNEAQFKEIKKKAEKTGQEIGDILVAEEFISENDLIKLQAYILGIPFVNLEKESIPIDVLKIIPEPIARTHNIVAFRKKENNLEVAMLDPEDLQTIEFIKKKAGLKILARLTTANSIKKVLQQYQKTLRAEFGDIIIGQAKTITGKGKLGAIKSIKEKEIGIEKENLKKAAEELPVIRIVDTLLKHAILQRASDIHIEPIEKEIIIRYRVDGILHDAMTLPKQAASGIVARIKVLSNLKLDEHRLPQDGRFKIESEDYKYSIRVSILPVFNGEKIVMRLLPEGSKSFNLESLGLRGNTLENIQFNIRRPVGMILVTGPTGSGKTTTLYAVLDILNTPEVNISTVEDPIEYQIPRINQTQVRPKIGLTFANGLRSLVRQDPDIIMVGEIRDKETAGLAINAALTGHLVLSTLHTTNAAGAIPRLIDMKAEPFLITSTLNVVIAQRLVRRFCSNKQAYKLKASEIKNLEKYCNLEKIQQILEKEKIAKKNQGIEDIVFYKPISSKDCQDGYKGRIGIYEVLAITESIKELIIKGATSDQIQEQAQRDGMVTMIEDGFVKAAQGLTSIEEVLRVIKE
ncbi:Flp pilus assembly complex ATPase component TadA [Candidatus Parcubacteria bacterium]|nr:Flp pilus assembly complex ATPase component TadA [Candidatus Parcubacteria bacterium]